VVFRFTDPAIVESSGLVVADDLAVTTNDSGVVGRVFAVDPASGDTVGVTTWSAEPVDVEALAPAGQGEVWVGDIGDNDHERPYVEVARVPFGRAEQGAAPVVLRLVLPEGPQDAEALLAHPRTGRLYLVTKNLLGGTVLAAPRTPTPGREHALRPVADVAGTVTDGAFTADGRHVVLRTYSRAVVYEFPGFTQVGAFDLPDQPQGEGLAVAPDGSLWLTTEGAESAVLRVEIPPSVARAMARPRASPSPPAATPSPEPAGSDVTSHQGEQPGDAGAGPVWWIAVGAAALAGAGLLLMKRRRRDLR
jgi:LPXTG-motif cell wall-anchored protein